MSNNSNINFVRVHTYCRSYTKLFSMCLTIWPNEISEVKNIEIIYNTKIKDENIILIFNGK